MSVQKVRYGSFNLMVDEQDGEFVAHGERAATRERIGKPVAAAYFDQVMMIANLQALRLSELKMA